MTSEEVKALLSSMRLGLNAMIYGADRMTVSDSVPPMHAQVLRDALTRALSIVRVVEAQIDPEGAAERIQVPTVTLDDFKEDD